MTNGTSEANYLIALSQVSAGDVVAMQVPNYMQMWGVARSLGARRADLPAAHRKRVGARLGRVRARRHAEDAPALPLEPNNPTGSVLSDAAMRRIVDRCQQTGTWLLSDEVYLGAEITAPRTKSFWGMGDRVIVTSGLSKAYGIPGVRIGWIVGPTTLVAECWSQHDYITIGPNKMSDRMARVAVEAKNRELCYAGPARSCGTTCRSRASGPPPSAIGCGGLRRTAGRHRADEVRGRHPEPGDRRARPRSTRTR